MNYYNEIDPFAANWIENLIKEGLIPNGLVDRRSIKEVSATDLVGKTQCHFFSGIAGWSYALELAGWPVDRPIWTGSCPCQPYSSAGKGKGDEDERNLWPDFFRLIRECRPDVIVGEQVASAIGHRWLDGIQRDLEGEGYAVGHCVLGAFSVGSPHKRSRLYWVAKSSSSERGRGNQSEWEQGGALHASNSGGNVGPFSAVADASSVRRAQHVDDSGERSASCEDYSANGSSVDCMANSTIHELQRIASAGQQPLNEQNGRACVGVVQDDADCSGRGELCGTVSNEAEYIAAECTSNPWNDYRIIHCTDGKPRRVGTGVSPLAHGIPRGMGSGQPELSKLVRSARSNRVGRLKGYGNAIVPQVAAAFIWAFMNQ